MTILNY